MVGRGARVRGGHGEKEGERERDGEAGGHGAAIHKNVGASE